MMATKKYIAALHLTIYATFVADTSLRAEDLGPAPSCGVYTCKAKIVRVIDGDTVVADIDLGFRTWLHGEHLRLYGIDAPYAPIDRSLPTQLPVHPGMRHFAKSVTALVQEGPQERPARGANLICASKFQTGRAPQAFSGLRDVQKRCNF